MFIFSSTDGVIDPCTFYFILLDVLFTVLPLFLIVTALHETLQCDVFLIVTALRETLQCDVFLIVSALHETLQCDVFRIVSALHETLQCDVFPIVSARQETLQCDVPSQTKNCPRTDAEQINIVILLVSSFVLVILIENFHTVFTT